MSPPGERRVLRFLLVWALAPLVFLSFSRGRSRPYALPVLPAYACLIAWASGSLVEATAGSVALSALDSATIQASDSSQVTAKGGKAAEHATDGDDQSDHEAQQPTPQSTDDEIS